MQSIHSIEYLLTINGSVFTFISAMKEFSIEQLNANYSKNKVE